MPEYIKERPVGSFVTENFRTAGVFYKHGIDFCCGGKQSLHNACQERGIDVDAMLEELRLTEQEAGGIARLDSLELDALTEYIVANHHMYINNNAPQILSFAVKVAEVHGSRHPETIEIKDLFTELLRELEQHMFKEERVLFPYIDSLAAARRTGGMPPPAHFGTVANPVAMMESEHDHAGDLMRRINELSSSFEPPSDACTTYRVLFQELEAFERDLHTHIHIENNILHPKAIKLEREAL